MGRFIAAPPFHPQNGLWTGCITLAWELSQMQKLGPTPDPLTQNWHFNETDVTHMHIKFEKHTALDQYFSTLNKCQDL